jgi:hypothetical protein
MGAPKYGEEFIKHEFDEAIAVQRAIVEAERQLGESHPYTDAKRLVTATMREDQRGLRDLERLGKPFGATGLVEEVAGGLKALMEETAQHAQEAESEAYEAHAVLLNLKRKQQDSASAMLKIARAQRNTEVRDVAKEFLRVQKTSAQVLADSLAEFAVVIASMGSDGSAGTSRSGARSKATSSRPASPA